MEIEQVYNNEPLQESLPDAIMVLGKGDPWKDEAGMDALRSMAGSVALLWHLAPDSRKPYILSTAANIEDSDNPKCQEYSEVLASVLLDLGIDPQYFIFRDWAFDTNIELRLLRRLYLSRFKNGEDSRIQIVAFHNKERVKKLLSFFKSKGKDMSGDVRVDKPREILGEYRDTEKFEAMDEYSRSKIEHYISSCEDDIKSERSYKLLDTGEKVFSILGEHSIFYPNNRTYIASLQRRVVIPYKSAVDIVCRDNKNKRYGRRMLDVASKLARR
jgi:acylphosphatase